MFSALVMTLMEVRSSLPDPPRDLGGGRAGVQDDGLAVADQAAAAAAMRTFSAWCWSCLTSSG